MALSTASMTEGLNERQIEAVKRTTDPLLVVAGPGSGKTLTIIRRIAHLIQQGIPPEGIIAVTFTNRAAREMRERLYALLGAISYKVFVGTFHLLGLRILRENTTNRFVVFNREEQTDILKLLFHISNAKAMDLADEISQIKGRAAEPSQELREVFDKYQTRMISQNALDFDDLILKPIQLLDNKDLLKRYRDNFRHVIVDEYQDINPAQYKLLRLLVGENTTICAVGDPDQAIYAFRGADIRSFLSFGRDFVGTREVVLNLNYRSSGNILQAASRMIHRNTNRINKEIFPIKGSGPLVVVASVPDEEAEGDFIAHEIESRLGGLSHYRLLDQTNGRLFSDTPFCFSDFAVIFRTNNQAKAIEVRLAEFGIPCRILGRASSDCGPRIYNIASFAKQFLKKRENRGQLFAMKAREFLEWIAKELQFDADRVSEVENHMQLIFGDSWAELMIGDMVNELNLLTPSDDFDSRAEVVTLMTLHMAKGLEYRVIFISGVEDGLIPYRTGNASEAVEEERRLFYVGMTRAREELFLVYKREGVVYGKKTARIPSPFLSDIPESFIQRITLPDRPGKPRRKQQMKLF